MTLIWINSLKFVLLLTFTIQSNCITSQRHQRRTSPRNSRRHVPAAPSTNDWETGLREATNQALNREGVTDPNLRAHIFAAPLVGKQDNVVPFGDIIVLGRGQLYSTLEGLKFVQDPYQNDCDECHNKVNRCGKHQCDSWKNPHDQLVALWTAKRIRHREGHGHKFETEYVISPIHADSNIDYLTKEGRFDYTMPGHVFVLKKSPPQFPVNNIIPVDNSIYNNEASEQYPALAQGLVPPIGQNHGPVLFNPPKNNRHTPSYPGFTQPPTRPRPPITNDPKEIQLYNELIDSLRQKTTTTANGPHRFELNGIPTVSTTFNKPGTTFVPLQTTLIQLPNGQFVPATTQQQTYPTVTLPQSFPTTKYPQFTPSRPAGPTTTQFASSPVDTTYQDTTQYRPQETTKPIQTTIHYFTPAVSDVNEPNVPQITTRKPPTTYGTTEIYSTTMKIVKPEYSDDFTSSLFPETTGEHKTTKFVPSKPAFNVDQDFETSLFPETTKKTSKKPTKKYKTKPTTVQFKEKTSTTTITTTEVPPSSRDEFPENFPTEPMKPITQVPLKKPYPNSINDQLPPPDKDTDTTIPYVSTAPTQKTTQEQAESMNTDKKVESTPNISKETTSSLNIDTTPEFNKETTHAYTTDSEPTSHITKITKKKPSRTTATKYTVPYTTVEQTTEALNTLKVTTDYSNVVESTTPLSDHYLPPKIDTETKKTFASSSSTTTPLEEYTTTTEKYIPQSTYKEPTTGTVYYTKQPQTTYGQRIPTTMKDVSEYTDTTQYVKATTAPMTTLTYVGTTKPVKYPKRPSKKPAKPFTDDFLVDNSQKPNRGSTNYDISNDDIFGSTKYVTQPIKTIPKQYIQSDISKDLFGGERNAKLIQDFNRPTPKIIYADFFEASTTPMPQFDYENFGTTFYEPQSTQGLYETTHELHPQTSQSYSTSISFKVNKRNKTRGIRNDEILYEPTIRAEISELDLGSQYRVYKAQLPDTTPVESTTKHSTTPNVKGQFDMLALQVLNHAKSIDYINKQNKPKYKRKFVPKRRNPPIKKK